MKQMNLFKQEMNTISVVSTKLVREEVINYDVNQKFKSPELIFDFLQNRIGDEPQECFALMCLDTKGKLTHYAIIHRGTINTSVIHPRDVFRTAILSNATSIVVAHNHPSGDSKPSPQDIEVTEILHKISVMMDIKLLDHLIIGNNEYFSFKEKGII